ncbi:hypothetical protein HYT57_05305 [Candidatus Woesearchaeota archaeon]|nr:hypothetical protein [Candidatus Woesearchaeota archaeon]
MVYSSIRNKIYAGAAITSLLIGSLSCNQASKVAAPENVQQESSGYKLPYNPNDPILVKLLALHNLAESIRDTTGATVQIMVCNGLQPLGTEETNCYGVVKNPVQESTKRVDIEFLDSEYRLEEVVEFFEL